MKKKSCRHCEKRIEWLDTYALLNQQGFAGQAFSDRWNLTDQEGSPEVIKQGLNNPLVIGEEFQGVNDCQDVE